MTYSHPQRLANAVIQLLLGAALSTSLSAQPAVVGTCPNCVQKFFGTTAPGNVPGNLPGDTYSDTTNHRNYWCNAPQASPAPACVSVAVGGWALLNDGAGGGAMVYPSSGIPTSTGSAWGPSYGVLPHSLVAPTGVIPGSYANPNITVGIDGSITAASTGTGGGLYTANNSTCVAASLNNAGSPRCLMQLNSSGNLQIDPNDQITYVTIGNGIGGHSGPNLLLQSGKLFFVSQDASQDIWLGGSDASNNYRFGNNVGDQLNDLQFWIHAGKTFHWAIAGADVMTLDSTNGLQIPSLGAVGGTPTFSGTKTIGACTITWKSGLVTNITGC